MSVLFCDSNCELLYTHVKQLKLNVIRMPYSIDGVEYFYDMGEKTDFKSFFSKMRAGKPAITSALNPTDYYDYFEPVFKRGEDIFYITFSSALSGTFQFMRMAIDDLQKVYPERKITYFDTKQISMGAGIVVYEAAKLHGTISDDELYKRLEKLRDTVCITFSVEDLIYLKRGGRISGAAAVFGKMLDIKPILSTNAEGAIVNTEKAKGRRGAVRRMVENAVNAGIDLSKPVVILHADDEEGLSMLREELAGQLTVPFTPWEQYIGPVIGVHCGPGTLGIAYFKK